MILLGDLLKSGLQDLAAFSVSDADARAPALSVTSDSREIKPGSVFVAIKGTAQDGHAFIPLAQQQGAIAILGEDDPSLHPCVIPYIKVPPGRARLALARLASAFYGAPSLGMKLIGVTGTSGKTTTTYVIESILRAAGHQVGVIGTVNFRYAGKILDSTHTTPGAAELQRLLAEMRDAGCTAVVMEVSSHALKMSRVAGVAFDGMVFNNLSPEHLDFHPDMDDYFRSKSLLFTELARYAVECGKRPFAAVNGDDPYGQKLVHLIRKQSLPELSLARFGLSENDEVSGSRLQVGLAGIQGEAGQIQVNSKMTGKFNAYNILGAIAVTRGLGVPAEAVARGVASLETVPGRLERVADPRGTGVHVLVDYAHKPDALEKVLQTLNEVKATRRIITVFGCGGDRDRKKRPVMGRTAAELSDRVYVTSDNPRTEDPGSIIDEIRAGIGSQFAERVTIEPDRLKAIRAAVHEAKRGDLVLIAGKGHEDYQIIADPKAPGGTRKIHFDDREVALEALRGKQG